MYPSVTPTPYKVFYIVVPIASVIFNGCIVYVTVRSRHLRNPCSILVAVISLADMVLVSSNVISCIAYNIIKSDFISHTSCVYLQLPSVFAACLSPVLLLNVALDRLFSLMNFYHYRPLSAPPIRFGVGALIVLLVVQKQVVRIVQASLLPGCALGTVMDVWAFLHRMSDEEGVCTVATPMTGISYEVYFKLIMITCFLTVLCYASFVFFLKKIRLCSAKVKSIYRSLIIISLTVVFGYLCTSVIVNLSSALNLNIEIYHLHLFAGAFANITTSINFFVYYAVSKEYRKIFDEYLGIGRIKLMLIQKESHTFAKQVTPSPQGSGRNAHLIA